MGSETKETQRFAIGDIVRNIRSEELVIILISGTFVSVRDGYTSYYNSVDLTTGQRYQDKFEDMHQPHMRLANDIEKALYA